jgi:hypothetical protein
MIARIRAILSIPKHKLLLALFVKYVPMDSKKYTPAPLISAKPV